MKRLVWLLPWGLMVLCCSICASSASANTFSPVPVGSRLYVQLEMVQSADWESSRAKPADTSTTAELTRYEFAIQVAKSAIDFNAHKQADKNWINTVPRSELRALRALVLAFNTELIGFDVDTQGITSSISEVLRNPAMQPDTSDASTTLTLDNGPAIYAPGGFSFSPAPARKLSPRSGLQGLSEKFRFYAQLSNLNEEQSPSLLSDVASTSKSGITTGTNTALRAGANMNINDWLSLNAGYALNRKNQPLTLQQTLQANQQGWFDSLGSVNTFGGGLDVQVAPSLVLSGNIAHLNYNAPGKLGDFSGTRLEGGVGVSGLSNRLMLSARLAHLMPDDAALFASTAARLNLDYALSGSTSLNLLYQRMFSASTQTQSKSTFAGGVNIHF